MRKIFIVFIIFYLIIFTAKDLYGQSEINVFFNGPQNFNVKIFYNGLLLDIITLGNTIQKNIPNGSYTLIAQLIDLETNNVNHTKELSINLYDVKSIINIDATRMPSGFAITDFSVIRTVALPSLVPQSMPFYMSNTRSSSSPPTPQLSAGKHLEDGNINFNKGNYDMALEDYNAALRIDPNYKWAYFNRGLIYEIEDNYERAIIDYTKVIQIDSKYKDAYYHRGNMYFNKGDLDNAINDYTTVIKLEPNNKWAYFYRGQINTLYNNLDHAISDYSSAIKIDSKFVNAYCDRGNAYLITGDFKNAIADYETILHIDPNFPDVKNKIEQARQALIPVITSIIVHAKSLTVERGSVVQFDATVYGPNNPAQTVTWRVTGGGIETSINSTGLLTIANNEKSKNLIVIATSAVDTSKSGSIYIMVSQLEASVPLNLSNLRNEKNIWSLFGVEAGILGMNDTNSSETTHYILTNFSCNIRCKHINIWTELKYELQPRDDLKDSKGNDEIGWSWLGFDIGIYINDLFTKGLNLHLTHNISYQLTPDYNWGSSIGSGYNGSFGFSTEFNIPLDNAPYINLYLPVTYAQAYSNNYCTQIELQTTFGLNDILSTGLGIWIRPDFGFTDELKWGIDNNFIKRGFRGITLSIFYSFESVYNLPLYTHFQLGIPNIDNYGIDIALYTEYTFNLENNIYITPWFEIPIYYLNNKLNLDAVVYLKLGLIFRW